MIARLDMIDGGPKVLVIDDNPVVRHLAAQFLEDAGYQVLEAADGKKGLELFYLERPAVVVTDILMPEREGLEIILHLRKFAPATGVVAVSGSEVYLDMARKLGVECALPKPLCRDALIATVDSLTAKYHWHHEASILRDVNIINAALSWRRPSHSIINGIATA